jgi:hypothetical protein
VSVVSFLLLVLVQERRSSERCRRKRGGKMGEEDGGGRWRRKMEEKAGRWEVGECYLSVAKGLFYAEIIAANDTWGRGGEGLKREEEMHGATGGKGVAGVSCVSN